MIQLREDSRSKYLVYFDVDDTLTDYSQRLGRYEVEDRDTGEKRPMRSTDTVDNVDFWTDAKWLPGAKQLFEYARRHFEDVQILSAVPDPQKYTAPIEGKREWLNKNVGNIKAIWTRSGTAKAKYANPTTILIDDKEENIRAFEKAGGIGILATTPGKALLQLAKYVE